MALYEGGFHDLLNDIDKELVMLDIKNWSNGRLPAAVGCQVQTRTASL